MDHTAVAVIWRRRNMCRLACNVCGVTTVNGSSVGSSSCGRLSTRCSLSVISPDRPSTAGVLAFLWILHVFCLDYHQPICVSVFTASASLQHLTTSSFCPEALLCFYCCTGITPTSVDGRPFCSHLPGWTYNITNKRSSEDCDGRRPNKFEPTRANYTRLHPFFWS